MNSYPASCDFMVARPPTYQESMAHFTHTQAINNKKTLTRSGPHNRLRGGVVVRVVEPDRVRESNRVRYVVNENTQNYYYRPRPRNIRKRFCNIL